MKDKYRVFSHFSTIKDDPGKFILWVLTSIVLSLSSVWIPTLLGWFIGMNWFPKLMEGNPFILFSIVFLSNSVLTSINIVGAGSNPIAVSIRGVTLVVTILYLVLLSSIIPLKLLSNISLALWLQFLLLSFTVLLGIYVYGFRETNWEKSVADAVKEQNRIVENVTQKAEIITNDGSEVEL